MNFYIGEFDIDSRGEDTALKDSTSLGYAWWQDFLQGTAHNWAGCWPVTIGGKPYPAAHKRIDYVRVWDVPDGMPIPDFPR